MAKRGYELASIDEVDALDDYDGRVIRKVD